MAAGGLDEAYATQLAEADRAALIDDDDDAPLGPLLALVAEALPLVYPDARTALDALGLSDATRLGAVSDAAAAAVYPQIAKALGGPPSLLDPVGCAWCSACVGNARDRGGRACSRGRAARHSSIGRDPPVHLDEGGRRP
jgi:hypothetical protein